MTAISKESLQRLLHDALISTKNVAAAGLVQRKDGKVRGLTAGFGIQDFEIKAISTAFKDVAAARTTPLVINGKDHECIRADGQSIYAKDGKGGIVVARTAGNFLIATYEEGMHPSICVEAVEKLAGYFREKGQ